MFSPFFTYSELILNLLTQLYHKKMFLFFEWTVLNVCSAPFMLMLPVSRGEKIALFKFFKPLRKKKFGERWQRHEFPRNRASAKCEFR